MVTSFAQSRPLGLMTGKHTKGDGGSSAEAKEALEDAMASRWKMEDGRWELLEFPEMEFMKS